MEELQHTEIKTKKITKGVYVAFCWVTSPIKSEMTMKGHTAEIAKEKLELFLNNKPYSHLDK